MQQAQGSGYRGAGSAEEDGEPRSHGFPAASASLPWVGTAPLKPSGRRRPLTGYFPSLAHWKLMGGSCGRGDSESQDSSSSPASAWAAGSSVSSASLCWRRGVAMAGSKVPTGPRGAQGEGSCAFPGFFTVCAVSPVPGAGPSLGLPSGTRGHGAVSTESSLRPGSTGEAGSRSLFHSHTLFVSHTRSSHGSSP